MNSGQTNAVNTRQGLGGATEGRLGFARVYKGSTSGIRAEYKRSTSDYLHTLSIPPVSKHSASPRWEHAHRSHPRDSVAYIDANYDPLVDAGRMRLIDADTEVAPGVWLRLAPGHTPNMMVVTASSAGHTFCFLTDLVPTAAHITPTWVAAFDLDPIQSIDS